MCLEKIQLRINFNTFSPSIGWLEGIRYLYDYNNQNQISMKSLFYILSFLFFSITLSAQDSTQTNYKNQIGYDLKPIINGLSVYNSEIFDEIDILYRRQLSTKNWCMVKLSYIPGESGIITYNNFDMSDSTFVTNAFYPRNSLKGEFSFSRSFLNRKNINLYYGATIGFGAGEGTVNAFVFKETDINRLQYLQTHFYSSNYKTLFIGPNFSLDIPITKRLNLFMNMGVLANKNFGRWNFLDENLLLKTEAINESWTVNYFLQDIALMYSF